MDDDRIKDIYSILKTKNKKEWGELMQQLTKDQKRKLIYYIKKKNKKSLNKIKNIKIDKNVDKNKSKPNRYYGHVLIDYSNVKYDLNLKNYIARILRIYKLEDNFNFIKGLHLYMNILCYVIFKKFSYEYKNDNKNKDLLVFLKKIFPFEFQNFQDVYNKRWSNDFTSPENIIKHQDNVEIVKEVYNVDDNKLESDGINIKANNTFNISDKGKDENLLDHENKYDNTSNIKNIANTSSICLNLYNNSNVLNHKEGNGMNIRYIDNNMENVLIKTEKIDEIDNNVGHQSDDDNCYDIGEHNMSIGENNKEYNLEELKKSVKKEFIHNDYIFKNKDIQKIIKNLFDEKRFDYRLRFRSILSQTLNNEEYKKYCDLREKLFKYKKNKFMKWISQFTKITLLDLYAVNFFIFLFLDRLYLIIETYIRLNYCGKEYPHESSDNFLEDLNEFQTFNNILNIFGDANPAEQENTLRNNFNNNAKNEQHIQKFKETYNNIIKEKFSNFFYSIELIYNVDVYNFKIKNKIKFEQLINTDISTYINETNVYDIINYDKNVNSDPWKALANFALLHNRNLKLEKFDCFSLFLIVRFKFYLEEFKENANIDYIYKTVKEEFDKVQNYLESQNGLNDASKDMENRLSKNETTEENKNDENEYDENNLNNFEINHLVHLYLDLQKELKKVNDYMKFYGNLISFVNFIQEYATKSVKNIVKSETNEKKKKYFDLSFFLSTYVKEQFKTE
ncbi:conserved Plasmodium protein, unknown function [Plasmodium berghei]|uniref:Uncharacterized protein n=2 Tax=Plasmodium berghei TaxID=5821 RepID=A0A509AND5_PLABA|nr:conserved Plasmodium protein, unknown function [Plasmodium berghei ANKA]CXI56604.1 conserved Plasmodium protein, unknown function [Plasmodium berghei]SCL95396.1 conserved Plasmodium protein, unknown function [Plasmodium berghei]SCM16247.1 conserved Plasmodium protein, unknown function [Plasmodium berghei]SCM18043.1 conserved Plasmodium protein, unknown function [Plasmodium berghei]SCN26481.1 conserved Plasmodium protein, unknown function [Plasmodium berghei]|eukprot:XP_034422171.1 conserved Plasmodium protein, unknown function [Plasmodium berghei ANKA]